MTSHRKASDKTDGIERYTITHPNFSMHLAWLPVSRSLCDAITKCVKSYKMAFHEFWLQALVLAMLELHQWTFVCCQTGCDASMIIMCTPRTVTCVAMETCKNVLKPQGSTLCKLNCHVPHAYMYNDVMCVHSVGGLSTCRLSCYGAHYVMSRVCAGHADYAWSSM